MMPEQNCIVLWGAHPTGYELMLVNPAKAEVVDVYQAGNSRLDSATSQSLPLGHPRAMTPKELREAAEEAARDWAAELGAKYAGEDPDYEDPAEGVL